MKKEEALEQIRKWDLLKEEKEVLETLIPELTGEDERIRREIIDFIQWAEDRGMIRHDYHQAKRPAVWIDYLEKQKDSKWSPSEDEMGVLYKLCYLSNQITDEDDTKLTRLYQDLKREYFNEHSFENMFPSEKQKENPKSADSISSDCVSDAKCEDRWHKVTDSLPDNGHPCGLYKQLKEEKK